MFAFSSIVNALQADSPYQGNVLVGTSSEAQLKEDALKQVLVKVSGNADITKSNESKQLLTKTQQMISQYGYRNIAGDEYFSALFDSSKINQALKEMQQPVWGDTRPTTLIWLIHDNELVSDNFIKDTDNPLSLSVQQTELARGIRVQFPLMDLDDNLALSVSDVKGRFYDQVTSATSRYERTHYVVAELQNISAERWKLRWQLLQVTGTSKQSRILKSDEFVASKSSVAQQMVDALADYYAKQYAVLSTDDGMFTQLFYVDGINSLSELSQLDNALNGMLVISSYKIVSAQDQLITVEAKLKGSVNSFKNTLIAQPHLQLNTNKVLPTSPAVTEDGVQGTLPADSGALYFDWR
jgi:hypothetical protein